MTSGMTKGIAKAEVALRWDPSPLGEPVHDLDLIAATYTAEDPYGEPDYLVHFDSRAPDGTITLNRDSRTGQGFGDDEQLTLELDRLADSYVRVVVGVAIQQREGHKTFAEVPNTVVRVTEDLTELTENDFSGVSGSTAATVAEFRRGESGQWQFHDNCRGFDTDPGGFAQEMGGRHSG